MSSSTVEPGYCQCGCGQKTLISQQTDQRRGFFRGSPRPFLPYHSNRKSGTDYLPEDRGFSTPCWIWQRGIDSSGYGYVWEGGRVRRAHRAYFARTNGPIPEECQLDHLCRVRECVNPDHLEAVTATENVRRSTAAKLTRTDVEMIHALLDAGFRRMDVAARFGVSDGHIYKVRTGVWWSDVAAEWLVTRSVEATAEGAKPGEAESDA